MALGMCVACLHWMIGWKREMLLREGCSLGVLVSQGQLAVMVGSAVLVHPNPRDRSCKGGFCDHICKTTSLYVRLTQSFGQRPPANARDMG